MPDLWIDPDAAAEIAALEARVAALEAALRDFEKNGLLCDLNPTRHIAAGNRAWEQADSFWAGYLRRADESIRRRAHEALDGKEQT